METVLQDFRFAIRALLKSPGFTIVAALGLSRGLSGFLVGVRASDPITYGAAGLFFAAIALAASIVPAWRALRVEPMRVLRQE